MMRKTFFTIYLFFLVVAGKAQNDRVSDFNDISWAQLFTTIKLHQKWDGLLEYQWRRTNGVKEWQQSLLRGAIQYRPNEQVAFALGYGWIETFPYGNFPIAAAGTFPEHRIFEQMVLKQPVNKLGLTHRFRVEQRWLGRRRPETDREIESWSFSHRFRYMLRAQRPVVVKNDFMLYVAAADEVFIGAGKNVGINIFDQNRLMISAGVKLSKNISVEAGYINQTVMQGRRINNQTIIQRNNGITLATNINL
jgi:sarcosine oxidase delta subunit